MRLHIGLKHIAAMRADQGYAVGWVIFTAYACPRLRATRAKEATPLFYAILVVSQPRKRLALGSENRGTSRTAAL